MLNQDGIGLRLTAMEFWKCSEEGIQLPFKDVTEPDCKFVIAESLPEQSNYTSSISSIYVNILDYSLQQHCMYQIVRIRKGFNRHESLHRKGIYFGKKVHTLNI